ncbi:hypothetical protein AB0C42_33995, partial [Micromonospora taraxaci]
PFLLVVGLIRRTSKPYAPTHEAAQAFGSNITDVARILRGGAGPNASTKVGRIWRPRRRHLADPMPALLTTHGIKALSDR